MLRAGYAAWQPPKSGRDFRGWNPNESNRLYRRVLPRRKERQQQILRFVQDHRVAGLGRRERRCTRNRESLGCIAGRGMAGDCEVVTATEACGGAEGLRIMPHADPVEMG